MNDGWSKQPELAGSDLTLGAGEAASTSHHSHTLPHWPTARSWSTSSTRVSLTEIVADLDLVLEVANVNN